MPLVSIITPCYNSQATIAQTIESVLAQTFKDWEMIIVDDCSTDGSKEIIQQYNKQDSRIVFVENTRASGAPTEPRNIAISLARGRYVAFLDSDDIWYENKLDLQLKTAEDFHTPFVFSNYEKISALGVRSNRIVKSPQKVGLRDMYYGNPIGCLTVLLDISIIKKFQFQFEGHEDCIAWIEILKKGIIAYNTNTVEAAYRESVNSVSSNKLKVLMWQWKIYRKILKLGTIKSMYYFVHYAINGLIKSKI